jgi:hypothetical protein
MSVVVLELTGNVEMNSIEDLKNPKPGVNYKYFEGSWNMLPDFDRLTSKKQGVADNFTVPKENSGTDFGVKYTGYIKIPKDGIYTFYLNSDDGSVLLIDGKTVALNDGLHAAVETSGVDVMKEGYHRIEVSFFQQGGGLALDVSIKGKGLDKQIIPGSMLFRDN